MSEAPHKAFIEIRGLHKALGTQRILRGMTLEVKEGETLVLIGPSGEGKSVLLKHIIGLMRPDAGEVLVEGQSLNELNERALAKVRTKLGFLFQNAALFDSLTVEQNVAFPLIESGLKDQTQITQRVHEALDLVELAEHKHKFPINLSGGMRKRVGIARAIVGKPRCILYDEPTAGLDPVVTDVIDRMIKRLQKRTGVTSIVVTHDMGSVFKIADRVAMLKQGTVRFLGTRDELKNTTDPELRDFIEGRSNIADD
jgi:phospholipid/cholesterol/gamma-HCH transport system ATP-binding protein